MLAHKETGELPNGTVPYCSRALKDASAFWKRFGLLLFLILISLCVNLVEEFCFTLFCFLSSFISPRDVFYDISGAAAGEHLKSLWFIVAAQIYCPCLEKSITEVVTARVLN